MQWMFAHYDGFMGMWHDAVYKIIVHVYLTQMDLRQQLMECELQMKVCLCSYFCRMYIFYLLHDSWKAD